MIELIKKLSPPQIAEIIKISKSMDPISILEFDDGNLNLLVDNLHKETYQELVTKSIELAKTTSKKQRSK
mgnify:CR=1 FL=1